MVKWLKVSGCKVTAKASDMKYHPKGILHRNSLVFLMSLNGHGDVFGIWWDRRNTDLRFVLTPWQYDKYVALNHFYRPVAWKAGGWTFAVYTHYNRGHFYNAHPKVFVSYKGGHNRVHGSHYAHMHKPAPAPAMGHRNAPMHDKGARRFEPTCYVQHPLVSRGD